MTNTKTSGNGLRCRLSAAWCAVVVAVLFVAVRSSHACPAYYSVTTWGTSSGSYIKTLLDGGDEEDVYVEAAIYSPTGRTSFSSSSGSYYATTTAFLVANEDYGDYLAVGNGYAGLFTAGPTNKHYKLGSQKVSFVRNTRVSPMFDCAYERNCGPIPIAPSHNYCGPTDFGVPVNPFSPRCYNFIARKYVFFKAGTSLSCWKAPFTSDEPSQTNIPCDDPIP